MKNFNVFKFGSLLAISFFFFACDNEDDPKGAYEDGIYITNEGAFDNDNGSISFYNYASDAVINNVYESVNGIAPGDVVQSMITYNDKAYIVVNNSNKIEVVNQYTCVREKPAITDIPSPRYMAVSGHKGYVSCWGDNSVKIIDLDSKAITKSITVGSGPEGLLVLNNKLYVANSGFGYDSTIAIIDLESEEIVGTIPVKARPQSLVTDAEGNIWALCVGQILYNGNWEKIGDTPSYLCKIDLSANSVVSYKLFEDQHPGILQLDNDGSTLYIGGGMDSFEGIYSFTVEGNSGTLKKVIDEISYGYTYDKASGVLFVGVVPNWSSAGILYRYSTKGEKLGEYAVGIGPNGASFKKTK